MQYALHEYSKCCLAAFGNQPAKLWLVTTALLLAAGRLRRLLGESVLSASEKLMGLVLSAVAGATKSLM